MVLELVEKNKLITDDLSSREEPHAFILRAALSQEVSGKLSEFSKQQTNKASFGIVKPNPDLASCAGFGLMYRFIFGIIV